MPQVNCKWQTLLESALLEKKRTFVNGNPNILMPAPLSPRWKIFCGLLDSQNFFRFHTPGSKQEENIEAALVKFGYKLMTSCIWLNTFPFFSNFFLWQHARACIQTYSLRDLHGPRIFPQPCLAFKRFPNSSSAMMKASNASRTAGIPSFVQWTAIS